MDILAHTLWAGAGATMLGRRRPIAPATVVATMTAAALPDIVQMLPVLAWWLFAGGNFDAVRAFAIALPGQEPAMPAWTTDLSHRLHCVAHSAVVAGVVTALLWAWRRTLWIPLLGWWSHIVIDVFTHSADYYPSPVLYPFTERGFDGIAWITPWFMALNYLALLATGLGMLVAARRRATRKRRLPPQRASGAAS